MNAALERLRDEARQTLLPSTTLAEAVRRLGFVQADPIRAPARAQDLILRHRVNGYRNGDLHRSFARLGLEEDFLYAYGFMPKPTRDLLHPRHDPAREPGAHSPTGLAAEVLAFVRQRPTTHPRDLETRFGRERETNNWGGFSKATTRALESLHNAGLLRVARREDGIRIYAPAPAPPPPADAAERARQVVLLVTTILAPQPLPSLRGVLALTAHRNPGLGRLAPVLQALLKSGALEAETVEGETYIRPAGTRPETTARRDVRLLAPFDPLVWDRRRFEHLWGWPYRFEAYTPPARRQMGYYAMPLLWGNAVIGWANLALRAGRVTLETGYATQQPRNAPFRRALEAERARMERFLAPPRSD